MLFFEPPGMIEAPPPPDTPLPTKKSRFDSRQLDTVRIFVLELPPSISPVKAAEKLIHQFVNRTSGTNHHHNLTGNSYQIYKCLYHICESADVLPFCTTIRKRSTTPSSREQYGSRLDMHPLLSIFKLSPITAKPISPISVLFLVLPLNLYILNILYLSNI